MKLKLEVQDNVMILAVSESVTADQIAILRAGLGKLIQAGKKTLLLDLSDPNLAVAPAEVKEIAALRDWASELGAQLMIASPMTGLGDALTRPETLKLLTSPLGRLLMLEGRLRSQLKALEQHKIDLEKKLASVNSGPNSVNLLKKENSDLKARIVDLEKQIKFRLDHRTRPYETPGMGAKNDLAHRILVSVLEQEGILPVT
ncbi:MAG: hypothetical protein NDJ89_06950 [Oligoflexia bacterium]|nr:hypothetical protein [Oligoflexia bacterium]